MTLSPKQIEVVRYWNREQPIMLINEGAVRSGKTFVDNLLFFRHVASYKDKRKDFIITAHTVPSTSDITACSTASSPATPSTSPNARSTNVGWSSHSIEIS